LIEKKLKNSIISNYTMNKKLEEISKLPELAPIFLFKPLRKEI